MAFTYRFVEQRFEEGMALNAPGPRLTLVWQPLLDGQPFPTAEDVVDARKACVEEWAQQPEVIDLSALYGARLFGMEIV